MDNHLVHFIGAGAVLIIAPHEQIISYIGYVYLYYNKHTHLMRI